MSASYTSFFLSLSSYSSCSLVFFLYFIVLQLYSHISLFSSFYLSHNSIFSSLYYKHFHFPMHFSDTSFSICKFLVFFKLVSLYFLSSLFVLFSILSSYVNIPLDPIPCSCGFLPGSSYNQVYIFFSFFAFHTFILPIVFPFMFSIVYFPPILHVSPLPPLTSLFSIYLLFNRLFYHSRLHIIFLRLGCFIY